MSFGGGGGWCSGACQNSSSWYLWGKGGSERRGEHLHAGARVREFEQLVPDEGWRSDGTQKALRRHSPKDGQDQKLPCMAQGHLSKRSQLLKRR
jgi:hypothetical protein